MKSLFITFALVVSFSTLVSAQQQAPLDYQYARRDDGVQSNKTVPGNVWGGSNGMGTKWCNTAYNTPANPAGICIWRLTDATVFPSGPGVQTPENDAQNENVTVQTDDNQKDNIISIYNGTTRYVVVRSTGGKNAIVAFDPHPAQSRHINRIQLSGRIDVRRLELRNYLRTGKPHPDSKIRVDRWLENLHCYPHLRLRKLPPPWILGSMAGRLGLSDNDVTHHGNTPHLGLSFL